MAFEVIDPEVFLTEGVFRESDFLERADAVDWAKYDGKKVLVRGCHGSLIPPWAFMYFTGKLAPYARSVRYGNEHDNVVIFRSGKKQ